MIMKHFRILFCSLAVFSLVPVVSVYADTGSGIGAITVPSADVTLSFIQPGRIAKVLVKKGDSVNGGQLLIKQDDAAEQAQ